MQSRAVAASLLLAVLLSGCAAGVDEPDGAGAAADASTPAPSVSTSAPPSPAAPQVRTISVAYTGGRVLGTAGREQVRLDEEVVLRVASDVGERVHVHGYGLEAAVPAGGSADLHLSATIPGVFEVELHESGKVLYRLRVS